MRSILVEPHFQPFEGRDYRNQELFPGRLLVLGESHYLRDPKKDDTPDFTQRILGSVASEYGMTGWKTRYFRNLFYILTGKRCQDVDKLKWDTVWNSIAFYNYIQSSRLTAPLMRPNREEWKQAREPFRTVLSRLKPELILITGSAVCGHAIKGAHKREGRPGVWIPTDANALAYTRCIYHPSSLRFLGARQRCRENFEELVRARAPE